MAESTAVAVVPTGTFTAAPSPSLPPTAIGIVSGMVFWVADILARNLVVLAALVVLIGALYYSGRRKRRKS